MIHPRIPPRPTWLAAALTLAATPALRSSATALAAPPGAARAGSAAARTAADTAWRAEARAAVRAFHDALAAGDSARAAGLLHPAVVVFEAGHAEDRAAYLGEHLAADMEFGAAVERTVVEEHIFGGEDWAVYTSTSRAEGTFRGRKVSSRGTESVVLVRTGEGWKIRHIHWSSA